ncbi:zinc metallopeptidase [Oceaniovalibus guishaninsula JLT2003]|uniref:Zinc metallopeptidase n=1 Tax=Oceaniovalibus guishaninsula JLT2003 TaxID=1231392 RepID=K2HGP2_9RHOB|nr:SprT family zinc-dependent metalloprotease [Oceaniovalibus guishaninsula]EKE45607.1 zinc metallopeptidase [Oceaniovalibus guishaninsula JLT2003]
MPHPLPSRAVLPGDPPVPVILRRAPRARRISLRVAALDGRVTLSVPHGVGADEALAFALGRGDWVRRHLLRHVPPRRVALGSVLPVAGVAHRVVAGQGRTPVLQAGEIAVDPARPAGPQVLACLKAEARRRLLTACDAHAAALGRGWGRLTLRDTRSRWGSCSSRGDLMFSWRLILAPPDVLDYVAAHEVAHLAHMDHSAAFWGQVRRLRPDCDLWRRWLRDNGATLHAWRFDAAAGD